MKRTPLKNKTPLRRKVWPSKARKRIKPVNRARRKRLFARNFGTKGAWIRQQTCIIRGCSERAVAAHAKDRGMGGCNGDLTHLVPLCWDHHEEQTSSGKRTFELRHGVDLGILAQRYHERWLAEQVAPAESE